MACEPFVAGVRGKRLRIVADESGSKNPAEVSCQRLKLSSHFFLISSSESCVGFFADEAGGGVALSAPFSACAAGFAAGVGEAAGGVVLGVGGVVGFEDLDEEIVFFSSDFFGCELDLVGVAGEFAGSGAVF